MLAVSTGKVHAGITTDVGMLEGKKLGLARTFRLQRPGDPICPCRLCRQALFLKNHENETLSFLRAISKAVYRMMADKSFQYPGDSKSLARR